MTVDWEEIERKAEENDKATRFKLKNGEHISFDKKGLSAYFISTFIKKEIAIEMAHKILEVYGEENDEK